MKIHLPKPAITTDSHVLDDWKATKLHSFERPKEHLYHCDSTVYSTSRQLYFNVTQDSSGTRWWLFNEMSPRPDINKSLRGRIEVERGDDLQTSDIELNFTRRGSHRKFVENVAYAWSDSSFGMMYGPQDSEDACVEVDVIIRFRPSPARTLDIFKIYSELLDIRMDGRPTWEIKQLIMHTSHGTIEYDGVHRDDPLQLHNVTASSVSGLIFGHFVANAHVKVHNSRGRSGVILVPNYSAPFNPESISVTSDSGEIHVELVLPYWPPQPLSHTTTVYSESGDVFAAVPHGTVTNITTATGKLTAVVFPYGTDSQDAKSEIYTSSRSSSTWVRVASSDPESLEGRYDPLLRTKSVHKVGEGQLKLWYPHGWLGTLEGWYGNGSLAFNPIPWDDVRFHRDLNCVWARRGWVEHSHAQARVNKGDLSVEVGWN